MNAPRINLLHGWGMNARVFDVLLPRLAGRFEIRRPELPGHGRSPWRDEPFEEQIERLAGELCDGWLMGWSMGGLYAMELAARHPGRFPGLLLVASNPCFVQRPGWRCAVEAERFDDFAGALMTDWQAGIRRFIGLQLQGDRRQRSLIRQVGEALREGGSPHPRALEQGLELLKQRDARGRLPALARKGVALRSLFGGLDRLVPPCLARELPGIEPSIDVECWPRSAHAPFLSAADAFADWICQSVEPAPSR